MRGCFRWLPCLGLILAFLCPQGAAAQSSTLLSTDDLSFRPLEEALIKWQSATGIDLTWDPELVATKRTRAVEPEDPSPVYFLRAMLEGTGLYYYRLSSGTYAIAELKAARASGRLVGYVLDHTTGEPLSNAHVLLRNSPPQGTVSSQSGVFSFNQLSPGHYTVAVSYMGYQPLIDTVEVWPDTTTPYTVELKGDVLPLTPAVVEADELLNHYTALSHTVTQKQWTAGSYGLGTLDAVRSLNNMMGVRVNDGMADVHIQGGESGEHQFRLDGSPIFEPVHLRGLLGAFNPFAISRITAHKAGFSVMEGSQLAGVINAEHALVDVDNHPVDVQADPLSFNGRLNLSFPISDVKAQVMAAYRSSMWSSGMWNSMRPAQIDSLLLAWNAPDQFLLRSTLLQQEISRPIYNRFVQRLDSLPAPSMPDVAFTDLHGAGRLRLGNGSSFYASYYRGTNQLAHRRLTTVVDTASQDHTNPDRYDWVNENAQAQLVSPVGSNMLLTTQLRTSLYDLRHEYAALDVPSARRLPFSAEGVTVIFNLAPADDGNRIRETALETTIDLGHRRGHAEFGAEVTHTDHRFIADDVFLRSIRHVNAAWRLAVFGQERFDLTSWWSMTGGTRLTYHAAHANLYAEPRMELRFEFPETPLGAFGLRTAGGVYRQFLNQFDISSISPSALFPSIRFWMPVDSSIAPPKAYHLAADVILQPTPHWTFRLENYYKDQPLLYRVDYPALWDEIREATDDEKSPYSEQEAFLEKSHGYAYGTAVVMVHVGRFLRSSARYEYSIARREYAFQDTVRMAAVPWSEPHRLEFGLDWTPAPRFIATARWRSGWGRIWGFRKAYYDFFGMNANFQSEYGEFEFQEPEDHALPAFHQLDLGAAYTQPLGPTALQFRVDVMNVTDRQNVADRSLMEIETKTGEGTRFVLEPQNRYLLNRTVSMSVRLQW